MARFSNSLLPSALVLSAFASLPAPAAASAPARLGDFSFGGGPAFVVDRGDVGGGAVAEFNLLVDWFALGLNFRGVGVDGEFRPGASAQFTVLGFLGVGAGIQPGGPSVDFSLEAALPSYEWMPGYLTVAYRPSVLVDGGAIHQIALQMKWSSLLVPSRD